VEAGLRSSRRYFEERCRGAFVEAFEVAQDEQRAMLGRQPRQSVLDIDRQLRVSTRR
jgi:hypothetical protein